MAASEFPIDLAIRRNQLYKWKAEKVRLSELLLFGSGRKHADRDLGTHPGFRGQGLATRLSRHVAAAVPSPRDTAFPHSSRSNRAAISLH